MDDGTVINYYPSIHRVESSIPNRNRVFRHPETPIKPAKRESDVRTEGSIIHTIKSSKH